MLLSFSSASFATSNLATKGIFDDENVKPQQDFGSVQRHQSIIIYVDILVNENGNVTRAKLASGQKSQGIFTQFALRKVKQLTFPQKFNDGKGTSYWIRNYQYNAGQARSLTVENSRFDEQ